MSVVVVSDYAAGGEKGWADMRGALTALARQDFDEPTEFLLVESERFREGFPADLADLVPGLRVHFFDDDTSYALKNEGVRLARGEYVAMLDADCIPEPNWLRDMVAVMRAHPKAGAVSGRSTYPEPTFSSRMYALLARAYLDPGHAGGTRFIASNSCCFRKAAYQSHPLPTGIGTFTSRMQSEAMLRGGWELRFDPSIQVIHDFEGWSMEGDVRRNAGYGTIATRLSDGSLPWARLVRLGPVAIPVVLGGKILDSWKDCWRCGRQYGLSLLQLPVAMLMSVVVHALEVPGMWQAYAGGHPRNSSFR